MDNRTNVSLLHQRFVLLVREILDQKFGICGNRIQLGEIKSGTPPGLISPQPCGDRFKLHLPYAGYKIGVEVLFNYMLPEQRPDFIFEDQDFVSYLANGNLDEAPSWRKWNPDDPKALWKVLMEFIAMYKKYQIAKLEDSSRLHFEYSLVVGQNTGILEQDLEVSGGPKEPSPVNFLMRLPLDLSSLPPAWTPPEDNQDDHEEDKSDWAALLVTFHPPDASRISSRLLLSPALESTMSNIGSSKKVLQAPSIPDGCCLMDYVPTVVEMLEERLKSIEASLRKRRHLLDTLQGIFPGSLLEMETDFYMKATFLLEMRDFHFVLSISLPRNFPHSKPILSLRSVYKNCNGKPFHTTCDNYPYSPRWTSSEMARRTRNFLMEYVETFQKDSMEGIVS